MRNLWKNNSLGIVLFVLFMTSWVGQFFTQYSEYKSHQQDHKQPVEQMFSSEYMAEFWSRTFENWQSEFLQLFTFVMLTIWLRQKGSHESKPVDAPKEETG